MFAGMVTGMVVVSWTNPKLRKLRKVSRNNIFPTIVPTIVLERPFFQDFFGATIFPSIFQTCFGATILPTFLFEGNHFSSQFLGVTTFPSIF
jgi:hypothetical protein